MSTTRTVPRLRWDEVRPAVRSELAAQLGSPVVAADSQEEGFSPGLAARCRLADGHRVFIKAITSAVNVDSRTMALHEIAINRTLPPEAPAPAMVAAVNDGEWVAAAWADVEGRLPTTPWRDDELRAVLAAVDGLELPAHDAVAPLTELMDDGFRGWRKLVAAGLTPFDEIEPWLDRATAEQLAAIEATWTGHCPPEALVHADIRADNVLLDRADGRVWIVDWANAALGPAWFDVVALLPSMAMDSTHRCGELWSMSTHWSPTDGAALDAVVVALAGFFTEAARRPPVAAIPMLRAFQEAQARPARTWMRERLGL